MLSFFPRDVLDETLNLIESVSEGFPSYSYCLCVHSFVSLDGMYERHFHITSASYHFPSAVGSIRADMLDFCYFRVSVFGFLSSTIFCLIIAIHLHVFRVYTLMS